MANYKIRQEINLTNVTADPVDSVEAQYGHGGGAECNGNDFNGETCYFEVVAKNSDSSAQDVDLMRADTFRDPIKTEIKPLSISASTNNWTKFRSSSFSLDTTEIIYWYRVVTTLDDVISVKSAKIIILQDAASITDTQTQIEVGAYQVWESVATAETYEPLSEPKIWKYESSKWDPTPTFTLGFTALNENDMDTSRVCLQESSDAAFTSPSEIANSKVSFTNEAADYYESSSFTLTDGYYYRLAYTNDDTMRGGTIYNAKVIATQSDASGISKLQPEYLLINAAQADTGNQEFFSFWDPDEWAEVSNTYYHEQSASHAGSKSRIEYDDGGSWTAIASSTAVGVDLQRSSSITMPSTEDDIDTDIIASS